jgi:leukotriene-A4 hydrolase
VFIGVHEICHSWSGNLVTNINWTNFWLNEGFTVFIERHTTALLYPEPYNFNASALMGQYRMDDAIAMFKQLKQMQYSELMPPMGNENPDLVTSMIPYEMDSSYYTSLSNVSQTTKEQMS